MGRPKKVIDGSLVCKLARIGCTYEEIATIVGCGLATLHRRFGKDIIGAKDRLKMSLRRMQLKSARNGSVPMQIWLGKQLLGQVDRQEITHHEVADAYVDPLESSEAFGGRISSQNGNGRMGGNGHHNGNGHS